VISGIQFSQFALGQQMPIALAPLFQNLEAIQRSSPELLAVFSEIHAEKLLTQ